MTKSLLSDALRSIRKNFSRYISILLIVALGTGFYVGIKAASPDMFATATRYFSEYNLSDLRIRSSIGFTQSDVKALSQINGVQYISGGKFADALVKVNSEPQFDIDGTQISTRAYSIAPSDIEGFLSGSLNGNYMNRVQLLEGNYPASVNECLVDLSRLSTPETFTLGSVITLENDGGEAPSQLSVNQFTIVGIIRSPLYLSFERGNTDVGSGKIGTFIIIPEEAFNMDYYTEVYVKIAGSDTYDPFSTEYSDFIAPYVKTIEESSSELISGRVEKLKPDLLRQITESQNEIAQKSADAQNALTELDETIASLTSLVQNGEAMLKTAQTEFDTKYAASQGELSDNTDAYNEALKDYQIKKDEYTTRIEEYNTKLEVYNQKKDEYDKTYQKVNDAYNTVTVLENAIATTTSLITAAENVLAQLEDTQATAYSNDQIQAVISVMQATYPELYSAVKALTASGLAGEVATNIQPYLVQQKGVLANQEYEIQEQKALLENAKAQLEQKNTALEESATQLNAAKKSLDSAKQDLTNYSERLQAAGYNIQNGNLELELARIQAQSQLNELKNQIQQAPGNLATAQQKRQEIQNTIDTSIAYAKIELSDAKNLYDKLEKVTWSIYIRSENPGYKSYGQTVNNIAVLSNIFPIFFFIISSLVTLTTMKRLVEEDRIVIGTYKALGYSNSAVRAKYFIYSFSACLFGCTFGIGASVFLFPYAINTAYSVMYSLPQLIYLMPWKSIAIGVAVSFFCTAATTGISVFRFNRQRPAVLMRPKVPKAGKRILLEKITFIWNRLNFISKVTLRNILSNKNRFAMTAAGIAGSAALLLAALGFYNSLSDILTKQYGTDAITRYDFQIIFDNEQSTGDIHTDEFTTAAKDGRISALELISMKSMTGYSKNSDKSVDVYVMVPENPSLLGNFIDLRTRQEHTPCTLDNSGAVITEMLANLTGVEVGDEIYFKDIYQNEYHVTVSAIAENYTFHYIYMTSAVYQRVTGSSPVYGYAIGNVSQSIKNSTQDNYNNIKGLLLTDLMNNEGITTVAFTADTTKSISEITNALSLVILLFFFAALTLAFVVLYNLSNINIIERTREIATLKVLGLNEREINSYIYRENILVSVIGIAAGLFMGVFLHRLLITYTAVDTVMYGQNIAWYSYVITVLITVLFIAAVDLMMKKKLQKIDMVLSLKSVE